MLMWVTIISLVIAGLYVWSLYKAMNNVEMQKQANVYMAEDTFVMHKEHDKFLYSNVTKVPRPRDNKGGGPGGHGGGPGGGGPRGGGPGGGGRR